jgi:hypothetical protein
MNDEIQAIVDLAIKNGYDIKDMSKILSDSGFGAEDISAAESMYDQSKKKSPTQEDLKELQLRSEQEYFASDISSNQPREAAVELYNAVMKGNGTDEVVSQNPDKYNSLYNAYRVTSGDPTVRSLPPSLFDEQGVVNQDAFNRLRRDSYRQLEYQLERDRKAYEEREAEIAKRQESYISVVSPIINGAESILGGVINFAGEVSGSETLSEAGSYLLEDVQLSSIAGMRNSGLTDEEISKGFLNNVLEGNIGTSLMILGPQLLQQVPQLALIAATGGTAGITTLGVSSAGSALEQVEGRKDMTSQEKMLYGVGAGLAESLSERLFMGDVRLLRKFFGGANLQNMTKKEFGDLLFAAVPPFVRSKLEEATEEAVASVAQQTLLNFIAGDEIDPIEIAESAIIGAIMGGSTYVLAKGVNSFGSSANAAEKAAVKKDISDINDAVNDPNISEKERDALSVALTEAQDRLAEIESKDAELYSKMTEEERQELVKINSSILKSINEYRGATHQVFKNQLIRKVESLVEQRNNIERKYYDSEKETGVPSPVVEGAPVVAAEPIVREGEEAPEAGRVLQAPAEEGEITTVFNAESPIAMAVGLDVMYDNPITGQRDNGELIQDGQRVVFRSQTGKEFDIGNIEELADVKPEDVGLVIAQEIVSPQISINKDGSLTYSGEDQAQVKKGDRLRIGSDLGINAIRRRKRGGYKVDAMNDSGQMVSVTGPAAEEIAYQITLAAAQTPAGIEQINQLIQQDEKAQQLLTEAIAANEQRRKNAKPAARPAKEGPKAAVAEPARKRVEEKPTAPVAKEPATPRGKMVKAVEDGKAFLKKSLKEVAIVTHDTRADFDKSMNKVSRAKASAPNVVDRGRFIRNTKTGKLEVHINLEQAREADVAHEIFHAVFYKFFGQSEKTAKQFANDLIKVLNTGNKFERGLAQQLDEFIKKGGYTKAEAAEEIIAETAGLLYQNSGKITTSMLDKIALFLNKIAERLKLDPLFTGTRNRAKIVELLNSFASAMSEQTGIDVTRIDDNKVFDKILKESSSKTIEQLFDATKAGLLIHATSGEFDTFDPEKIYGGSRSVYGYGFYFTGWPPKAKDYGNKFIFTPSDKYNLIDVAAKINSEFVNELIKKSEKIKDPLLSPYVDAIVNEMTSMLADGKSVYIDEVRKRLVNRYKLSDQEFSEAFKSLGYDGFSAESALTDYYEVIIFNTEKLNENLVKDEVEYISKEGTQKSFTEAASKIAEKSSKVITAEDKELVLTALKGGYIVHATKSEFRVFDPNRIERTAYGFGFYFTGQDDLAKSYGNRYSFIYSNELNLYEGNATISEAVLNRIKEAAETENEKLLAREIEVLYTRDGGEVRKYNRMNGIPVDVLNQKLIKEAILQGKDPEKAFTVVTNEGLVSIPTSLEAERQLSVLLTKAGIDGFYTEVKEKYLRLGNAIDVAVVFNFEKLNKYVVSIEEIVGDYSRVALIPVNLPKPAPAEYNFGHGNVDDAYDVREKASKEEPETKADKLIDAILNKHWSEIQSGYDVAFGNGMFGTGIYGVGLDGPEHIAEFSMKTSEFDGEDIVVLDNFASVEGMIGGKRKGNGRRALRGILRLADEYGVRVKLLASPITMFKDASKATKEKLIKFYASEGFEPMKGESVGQMIRPVGAQPQKEKPLPLNNERYWGKDTADVTTLEEFIKREEDFDPNYVGEFSQEELDNLPPSIISDMFFDGYNEDYGNIESFEKQGKNESWAFVSPQNRGDKETTPEQNEKALKDAESWFKENDLSPNKVYTMFNGLKRVSFFVPNMSIKQVSKFNEQFEQINSLHSSGIVSQVPMNNSSRLTIEDEYGDPHGVWTVPTDIGYDDNYIVAKKWDGEIAYFKPQYDDGDAVFESEMDMDTPPEDRSSKEVIQSLESGRFEITEDGKGNYVFFHYSPEKIDTVDPKFFGKNAYTSDRRITPISFYYTAPNRQETMVSGDPNVVLVKKEEVYPFTTDPLNLYDEAKKLHDEYYGKIFKGVKKAFDAPSQATWIMRVAADRGYKVLIAAWNDVSRAETPLSMKVDKAATAEFIKSGRKRIYAGEDLRTIGMVDRSSRQVDDMESRIKDREVKSLAQRIKDTVFWNPEQKQVRSLKESMVGDLTVEGWNIRRFNNRLNELLKKNPEASGYVNEILNGYLSPDSAVKLESLSNGKEIADHAYSMRAYIDKFSSDFLNGEEFASFSPELRKVIEKNIGQYVRKSYRFWKDKNFKPTKRARINAIKFEYESLLAKQIQILERSGKTPLEIDEYLDNEKVQGLIDQATGIIDRYIAEAEQIRKGPDFRASGMVRPSSIKLPSQQFMKRKNLPETIQELLGVEKDPLVRFTDTTWALANIKYKAVMLNNMLKQLGPNVIKDTQEVTKSEESSKEFRQIKDEYSPMNGKWVRSDLFEVISDESLYTSDLAWLQLYFNILKVARKSKVVYNIPTWRKNITGGWYTMLANGVLFNQNIVADISNRAKQLYGNAKGKELMQKEIYDQLGVMGKYGLLGTSVDANMIGLMDITMNSAITGEVDDNKAMAYFNKFVSKGKSLDKWATENYSFIDDYTKLVVFRNEVQMTAKKLYGKEYSELSQEELNEVNRYAAERVKENTPTFSRLPRFYKTLAKMPFGDFLSFELEAIRSIYQNTTNGLLDVKKGMSDTSLNDVQKKAYIRSGMSRLVGVSSLLSIRLAITAGIAAAALGDDEDLDEAAKAVRPDWMDGHSLVITNINKNGEVTAYDYSLEDPYGNVFDAVTDPMGLPKHIWELFGPNMAAEFIFNVSKGKDVYGRDIAEKTDGLLNSAYKYTSYGVKYLFVPPAISSYYRDYIKGGSAEKPKDYFTALISRSTIRDYKYNAGAQFSFSTKELSTGKKDFNELSSSGKRVRMKQLEEIRNQYQAIVEIGMSKGNFEMIQRANMSVRRNFSRLERAYIFYGYELK